MPTFNYNYGIYSDVAPRRADSRVKNIEQLSYTENGKTCIDIPNVGRCEIAERSPSRPQNGQIAVIDPAYLHESYEAHPCVPLMPFILIRCSRGDAYGYDFGSLCAFRVPISSTTVLVSNDSLLSEIVRLVGDTITKSKNHADFFADTYATLIHYYPEVKSKFSLPICCECGEPTLDFRSYNGKIYCRECFSEQFLSCSRCGENSHKSEVTECRDGSVLCKKCGQYHFITPYHRYYPKLEFFGDDSKNAFPYLGIELEVDDGGEDNSSAAKIVKILNKENVFAYTSHDGSLSNGFEIITQPATKTYHESIAHVYKRAFAQLKKDGYFSHDTTTCGLHVHFNRSFFGDKEEECVEKLLIINEKFWENMVIFARRNERRMSRYSKKISPMAITEYIGRSNKNNRNHEWHYYAVNLSNTQTIEFRMFKGTLNVDTYLATIRLVNNMAIAAKFKTKEEIESMKWEELIDGTNIRRYWNRRIAIPDTEE